MWELLDNFGSLCNEQAKVALNAVSMDRKIYRYLFFNYISDFAELYDSCTNCELNFDNRDKTTDNVKKTGAGRCNLCVISAIRILCESMATSAQKLALIVYMLQSFSSSKHVKLRFDLLSLHVYDRVCHELFLVNRGYS